MSLLTDINCKYLKVAFVIFFLFYFDSIYAKSQAFCNTVATCQPLAEQGNASAQYNLGVIYDNALGVPQNYSKAAEWYARNTLKIQLVLNSKEEQQQNFLINL